MNNNDILYYVSLKALINKNGKILLLRDPQMNKENQIEIPGGKMQHGETDFHKTLKREVKEETGLYIRIEKPYDVTYFEFDEKSTHRNRDKKIFIVVFECFYLSGKIRLSCEHDAYWWVDKNTYKQIFTSKSNLFKIVKKYFNEIR